MNKKTLLYSGALLLLLFVLYFAMIYDKKGSTTEQETTTPQPPTYNGNGGNSGSGILPTTRPLDPYSGEGKEAIESFMKSLKRSESTVQRIVSENNINRDILIGVSGSSAFHIKQSILSNMGISSFSQIPVYLKDDSIYTDAINNLIEVTNEASPKFEQLGRDPYTRLLGESSNFSGTTGLVILPVYDKLKGDFVNDAYNNGKKCGDGGCSKRQRMELAADLNKIGNNLLKEQKKFNEALFFEAIDQLINNGWDFIGFTSN